MIRCLVAAALLVVALPASAQELGAPVPFPDEFFYQTSNDPAKPAPRNLEGKPCPEITVADWSGRPTSIEKLRGRVILIDFWATWCGPCKRALPKNVELWKKYRKDGLTVLGINQTGRGANNLKNELQKYKITYPNAVDVDGQTGRALGVRFYPTYIVVDHNGIVRAAGLNPKYVPQVVEQLIQERNGEREIERQRRINRINNPTEIPRAWLEGDDEKRKRLNNLEVPPQLYVHDWMNTAPVTLSDLQGQIIVLDFWGTWCQPCVRETQKLNQLHNKYKDQGVTIIGIHTVKWDDKFIETALDQKIEYPIARDLADRTGRLYKVDGYPDYYLIDRVGRLRAADLDDDYLEQAIQLLLEE